MAMPDRLRSLGRTIAFLVIIAVVVAGAWAGWPRVFPPASVVASIGTITQTVVATGRVAPLTEVTLANGIPGRIKAVLVKEGDMVKPGQAVILFDDHELVAENRAADARVETARADVVRAARTLDAATKRWLEVKSAARSQEIERARAELAEARQRAENAEAERRRLQPLLQNDYISKSQYDAAVMSADVGQSRIRAAEEALSLLLAGTKPETVATALAQVHEGEAALKRAEAQVRQAVAERDRTRSALKTVRVDSTIGGRVTKKIVEPGEAVDISMPLLTIGDVSKIIVKAEVDETDVGKLTVGQQASVTADAYPGRVFPAVIYEIGQAVGKRKTRPEDPVKIQDMKVLEVKLEVTEGGPSLKLGMTVDVKITVDQKANVLTIPRRLVERGSTDAVVAVIGSSGPEDRKIVLGASDDAWVEVTAGLKPGEKLLVRRTSSP
jgi:ABC exporter DevB family membrane fusion protein